MNVLISAFVGVVVATATLVGGVNAVQGDQKPVSQDKLYTYSDE